MVRIIIQSSSILVLVLALLSAGCSPGPSRKEVSDNLQANISLLQNEPPVIEGSLVYNPTLVTMLYQKGERYLSPRWDSRENIEQMIAAIRNSGSEGLNPEDYHLSAIEELAGNIGYSDAVSAPDIARLEILLTDALLLLSAHLSRGKINSESIDPQWKAARRTLRVNLEEFVDSILSNGRIAESLTYLTPRHNEYHNLRKALEKYRVIEDNGGWELFLTTMAKIEEGMADPDIARLRKRLSVTQGPIEPDTPERNLFDRTLRDHVVLFQRRNGLTPDGIVGRATVEALNITVQERIAAIEANLERWRWLSEDLGRRYIRVNIANYDLHVIEEGEVVFSSEAIVGRPYRRTPVFSSLMTFLVFNPDWIVPPGILHNDVIPAVIRNPGYLADNNMSVLRGDGTEVDPASIDWRSFSASGFPYRIRQAPGRTNALGRVKFMFPNQYNVYIHDTPARNLFVHTDRSFSSGCIRIDRPLELAEYLLKDNPAWNSSRIREVTGKGAELRVNIPDPIRVHILYMTAWATDDGTVYFRRDVYDRDRLLISALREPSPGTSL